MQGFLEPNFHSNSPLLKAHYYARKYSEAKKTVSIDPLPSPPPTHTPCEIIEGAFVGILTTECTGTVLLYGSQQGS